MSVVPPRHAPVLAAEVVGLFNGVVGLVVDATVGLGGHAAAILAALPTVTVLGVDRDREALAHAAARLAAFGTRARLVQGHFSELVALARDAEAVGLLADLGVSSLQLDEGARGFSFRVDAPLDMRMDQASGEPDAASLLAGVSEAELAGMLRANGLGSLSGRIARAIVRARPITTTAQLAGVVERATPPARRGRIHPATKVFQALRIRINSEVEELDALLEAVLWLLVPGGVCQVISYHSGEDRVVKRFMEFLERGGCRCDRRLGCVCGASPLGVRLTRHAVTPSPAEIEANPRARSARLRAARIVRRDPEDAVRRLHAEVGSWHA